MIARIVSVHGWHRSPHSRRWHLAGSMGAGRWLTVCGLSFTPDLADEARAPAGAVEPVCAACLAMAPEDGGG